MPASAVDPAGMARGDFERGTPPGYNTALNRPDPFSGIIQISARTHTRLPARMDRTCGRVGYHFCIGVCIAGYITHDRKNLSAAITGDDCGIAGSKTIACRNADG